MIPSLLVIGIKINNPLGGDMYELGWIMPKFAANLTFLFTELPFLERFEAAADAGFEGVEVLFPYDDATTEIVKRLNRAKLPMVLMNTPPPNWTGGGRGFAADPDGIDRFRKDFRRSLRYAERLKPQHIHVMSGNGEGDAARATFIENLAWAAEEVPDQSLTIEPLNGEDMPGYFMNDYALAAQIIEEVGAPNLSLQYDAYHSQVITGDALAIWDEFGGISRHVQIGSTPGRHEPKSGPVDFAKLFKAIDDSGYDGFVSAEFHPTTRTEECLGWMKGQF